MPVGCLVHAAELAHVLDLFAQGRLSPRGLVGQEAVALAGFLADRFGAAVYAGEAGRLMT